MYPTCRRSCLRCDRGTGQYSSFLPSLSLTQFKRALTHDILAVDCYNYNDDECEAKMIDDQCRTNTTYMFRECRGACFQVGLLHFLWFVHTSDRVNDCEFQIFKEHSQRPEIDTKWVVETFVEMFTLRRNSSAIGFCNHLSCPVSVSGSVSFSVKTSPNFSLKSLRLFKYFSIFQ